MGGGNSKSGASSSSNGNSHDNNGVNRGPSSRNGNNSPKAGSKSKSNSSSSSSVIDLSQLREFVHQGNFIDNGDGDGNGDGIGANSNSNSNSNSSSSGSSSGSGSNRNDSKIPPNLGSQLLNSLNSKHRGAWSEFFSKALQGDASREALREAAARACGALQKEHIKMKKKNSKSSSLSSSLSPAELEKGARQMAAGIQTAVGALKWPLDALFGRALLAVEEEVRADLDMVWTELSMGDVTDMVLKHLGPGANAKAKPELRQSVRVRSLLVRAIQAVADAVERLPPEIGIQHTLADDCFLSLSISQFMRAISPFMLEKSKSGPEVLKEFRRTCDSKLFDSDTPLEEHMAVLDAVGKELFLNLYAGTRVPMDIVLSRETVFEDLVEQLRAHESRPLENGSVATLRAYFRSEYGKKQVNGVQVEEGEGLGPRKEFYSLASLFLQSAWKDKASVEGTVSVAKGDTTIIGHGTRFKAAILPKMQVSLGLGEDDSPQNETAIVAEVVSDTELKLERRVQSDHSGENMWSMIRTDPLFVYSKSAEAYHYNAALPDTRGNRDRFLVVGRMVAAALADRCKLDTVLAVPIFAQLMHPDLRKYRPSVHDLHAYDASLAKQVTSVRKMSKGQLQDMIEEMDLEDSDSVGTADEYILLQSRHLLMGSAAWQAEAMHRGFNLGVQPEWWKRCSLTPLDLQTIVCGAIDTTADFDFRKVFRVVEDPELQQCAPLRTALWSTIDGLDRHAKRKLLRFITGVDRLPSPGTEMIKIEMPFTAFSAEEHTRTLLMMPQAHTCDNILELPNYWQSLQKVRDIEDPEGQDQKLVAELRGIIKDKVSTAFSLSDGFGLDMAFSD